MSGGDPSFIAWAIVEMMGHQSIAGRLSEQTIAGDTYLRVDVPLRAGGFYTRLLGKSSIYAINVTTPETARQYAHRLGDPLYALAPLEAVADLPAISGGPTDPEARLEDFRRPVMIADPDTDELHDQLEDSRGG